MSVFFSCINKIVKREDLVADRTLWRRKELKQSPYKQAPVLLLLISFGIAQLHRMLYIYINYIHIIYTHTDIQI